MLFAQRRAPPTAERRGHRAANLRPRGGAAISIARSHDRGEAVAASAATGAWSSPPHSLLRHGWRGTVLPRTSGSCGCGCCSLALLLWQRVQPDVPAGDSADDAARNRAVLPSSTTATPFSRFFAETSRRSSRFLQLDRLRTLGGNSDRRAMGPRLQACGGHDDDARCRSSARSDCVRSTSRKDFRFASRTRCTSRRSTSPSAAQAVGVLAVEQPRVPASSDEHRMSCCPRLRRRPLDVDALRRRVRLVRPRLRQGGVGSPGAAATSAILPQANRARQPVGGSGAPGAAADVLMYLSTPVPLAYTHLLEVTVTTSSDQHHSCTIPLLWMAVPGCFFVTLTYGAHLAQFWRNCVAQPGAILAQFCAVISPGCAAPATGTTASCASARTCSRRSTRRATTPSTPPTSCARPASRRSRCRAAIRQGDADGSADGSDGDGGGGGAAELAAHAADAVAAKGAARQRAGAPPKGPHSRAHLRGAAPDGDDAHSGLRRGGAASRARGWARTPVALAPALSSRRRPAAPTRRDRRIAGARRSPD